MLETSWTLHEDTSMNQIKGQLSFFEQIEDDRDRKSYATPCGGCICNQCANDVNGRYKPGEMVEPCFNCDDCRNYDGNMKNRDNWRSECGAFVTTDYHAQMHRKKIKLIR